MAHTVESPTAATAGCTGASAGTVSGGNGDRGTGSGTGGGDGGGAGGSSSASHSRASGPAVGRARSDSAVIEIISIPEESPFDALPASALPASALPASSAAATAGSSAKSLHHPPAAFTPDSSHEFSAAIPGASSSSADFARLQPPSADPRSRSPSRSRSSSSSASSSRTFSFAAARGFFSGRLGTLSRSHNDPHHSTDATRPFPDAGGGAESSGGGGAAEAAREENEVRGWRSSMFAPLLLRPALRRRAAMRGVEEGEEGEEGEDDRDASEEASLVPHVCDSACSAARGCPRLRGIASDSSAAGGTHALSAWEAEERERERALEAAEAADGEGERAEDEEDEYWGVSGVSIFDSPPPEAMLAPIGLGGGGGRRATGEAEWGSGCPRFLQGLRETGGDWWQERQLRWRKRRREGEEGGGGEGGEAAGGEGGGEEGERAGQTTSGRGSISAVGSGGGGSGSGRGGGGGGGGSGSIKPGVASSMSATSSTSFTSTKTFRYPASASQAFPRGAPSSPYPKSATSGGGAGRAGAAGSGSGSSSSITEWGRQRWWFGRVIDPRSPGMKRWSRFYAGVTSLSLFSDPCFLYMLSFSSDSSCLYIQGPYVIIMASIRTLCDVFYLVNSCLALRTSYVSRQSMVLGRGELETFARKVAVHHLTSWSGLFLDVVVVLPIPQVLCLIAVPYFLLQASEGEYGYVEEGIGIMLSFMLLQYCVKVYHTYVVARRQQRVNGYVFGTSWWGFVLNMLVFLITAHGFGGLWYVQTVQSAIQCLVEQCNDSQPTCTHDWLTCPEQFAWGDMPPPQDNAQAAWGGSTNVTDNCFPPFGTTGSYNYGIYDFAVQLLKEQGPPEKIMYGIFFGIMTLATFGNALVPSASIGQSVFSLIMVICGLLLFTSLIGNIEVFLHSMTARIEDMHLRRRDLDWWMQRRQLPTDLQMKVRRQERHTFASTRGLHEEELLDGLPDSLQRDVRRHLCRGLVRRVPLFEAVDEAVVDNICAKLRSVVLIAGTQVARRGEPVEEMLFIARGLLRGSRDDADDAAAAAAGAGANGGKSVRGSKRHVSGDGSRSSVQGSSSSSRVAGAGFSSFTSGSRGVNSMSFRLPSAVRSLGLRSASSHVSSHVSSHASSHMSSAASAASSSNASLSAFTAIPKLPPVTPPGAAAAGGGGAAAGSSAAGHGVNFGLYSESACEMGPGHFSGEELLSWALSREPDEALLPKATMTLTAVTVVEAFSLSAADLCFIASHFRFQLRDKKLRALIKYYSPHWRTWAAVTIQLAWRRRQAGRGPVVSGGRAAAAAEEERTQERMRLYTTMFAAPPKPAGD
ncbi:unnamed protein product [Closterium sp. Naga37s-1]|nr:unnamed protein product [Closterium sp. Naga37s-1]